MSYAPPDLSVTPPYRPAPYLIPGPGAFLTSEELTQYFEGWLGPTSYPTYESTDAFLDFYSSLEYVNTAPQIVFDRLIGNVHVFPTAAISID